MAEQLDLSLQLLCSSQKLERDKGIIELQKYLADPSDATVRRLETEVQKILDDPAATWEQKHGAVTACKLLLQHDSQPCSDDFLHAAKDYSLRLLEDCEFRVRIAAGKFHIFLTHDCLVTPCGVMQRTCNAHWFMRHVFTADALQHVQC